MYHRLTYAQVDEAMRDLSYTVWREEGKRLDLYRQAHLYVYYHAARHFNVPDRPTVRYLAKRQYKSACFVGHILCGATFRARTKERRAAFLTAVRCCAAKLDLEVVGFNRHGAPILG